MEVSSRSTARPEKVQELDALIEHYLKDSHAVVPLPNPDFDPAQYRPDTIGAPGKQHQLKPADAKR